MASVRVWPPLAVAALSATVAVRAASACLRKQDVLGRLLRRAEFLSVTARGRKWVAPGVIVQLLDQPSQDSIRLGLTASRRVGGAVERNRARRRLRALATELLPQSGLANCDVVLIARPETVTRKAPDLRRDVEWCLRRLQRA